MENIFDDVVLSEEIDNKTEALFNEINENPKVDEFFKRRIQNLEMIIERAKASFELLSSIKPVVVEQHSFHSSFKDPRETKDEKLGEYVASARKALEEEIKFLDKCSALGREKIPALEQEKESLSRTFKEEWLRKGVSAVKTLVEGGVYTKEEMDALLIKHGVSSLD